MVREEHVNAIRSSLASIVAKRDPATVFVMNELIHRSKLFRDCLLNPMRDNPGTSEGVFYNGWSYGQDIEDVIESLRDLNVDLPCLPVDDFCETLEQALDSPHY